MAKLTIQELKKIRENASRDISLRQDKGKIKVTVHMGTCGIAAGAREVMSTLMDEIAESKREDIRVVTSGCMGMCSSEPNITVETEGAEPIVYQKVNANVMRQIFRRHILLGEVQSDFALAKM
ncbi:MAG: ferredoxin [Desulfococcaceae bacterium]